MSFEQRTIKSLPHLLFELLPSPTFFLRLEVERSLLLFICEFEWHEIIELIFDNLIQENGLTDFIDTVKLISFMLFGPALINLIIHFIVFHRHISIIHESPPRIVYILTT